MIPLNDKPTFKWEEGIWPSESPASYVPKLLPNRQICYGYWLCVNGHTWNDADGVRRRGFFGITKTPLRRGIVPWSRRRTRHWIVEHIPTGYLVEVEFGSRSDARRFVEGMIYTYGIPETEEDLILIVQKSQKRKRRQAGVFAMNS